VKTVAWVAVICDVKLVASAAAWERIDAAAALVSKVAAFVPVI
jgi:hypothetical protein